MKIGFFDSGLGGLLVMEHCRSQQPHHDYIFLGDTKYLPYGPRSTEEIIGFSFPCILLLLETYHCDLVVIACNTISVRAVDAFRQSYPQYAQQVVGIDTHTVNYLKTLSTKTILAIATMQTKESGRYQPFCREVVAMPGLVELIEDAQKDAAMSMCDDVLAYHKDVDHLLLGCTHFLWLYDDLHARYPHLTIIRQDQIIAEILPNAKKSNSSVEYLVTNNPDTYQKKYQKAFALVSIPR